MAKLNALAISRDMAPGRYGDGGGLYLLVGPTGAKSWVFRFKVDKQERNMGLGAFPAVSLGEARRKAEDARRVRADGKDPICARDAERVQQRLNAVRSKTFKECGQAYIADNAGGWKNAKHKQQWVNTLETYVYPQIGKLPVSAIDKSHVLQVMRQDVPARAKMPAGMFWIVRRDTAGRVRARIELILDWATASDFRTGENPARMRGNLAPALPRRGKLKRRHHPALPYARLPEFMADLRKQEGVAALALEFLILNAPRTTEVLKSHRTEIDDQQAVWTIPEDRMKGGKEHRVPLSGAALDVLQRAKELRNAGEYIFPGRKPKRPLSNMAMLAVLKRLGYTDERGRSITVHGFRSTFKDWVSDCTNFPPEVSEMALAHVIDDETEAAYRRGDLLEKRKALMEAWAAYCERIPGGNVVQISKAVA